MLNYNVRELPSTGAISMSQVRTELGLSGAISLGQSSVRELAGVPSGTIAMSDLRGKSNTFLTLKVSAEVDDLSDQYAEYVEYNRFGKGTLLSTECSNPYMTSSEADPTLDCGVKLRRHNSGINYDASSGILTIWADFAGLWNKEFGGFYLNGNYRCYNSEVNIYLGPQQEHMGQIKFYNASFNGVNYIRLFDIFTSGDYTPYGTSQEDINKFWNNACKAPDKTQFTLEFKFLKEVPQGNPVRYEITKMETYPF